MSTERSVETKSSPNSQSEEPTAPGIKSIHSSRASSKSWLSLQPRYVAESRYGTFLQHLLFLLVIICIGSLGSLPLASRFFTQGTSNEPPMPFTEGTCIATPQNMQYSPSPVTGHQTTITVLPPTWFAAGRTERDFAYAQACAATFVAYYESFDSQHLKTLEAAVSMLSETAKQHFYLGGPHTKSDSHMDPQWRLNLQRQALEQSATVSLPSLRDVHYANGQLVVWLDVPYQVTVQKRGNSSTRSNSALMRVQLNAIPPDPQSGGTGWNVESWQDEQA